MAGVEVGRRGHRRDRFGRPASPVIAYQPPPCQVSGRPITENDHEPVARTAARRSARPQASTGAPPGDPSAAGGVVGGRRSATCAIRWQHVRPPASRAGHARGVDERERVYQTLAPLRRTAPTCNSPASLRRPSPPRLAALEEDEMELGSICIDMGGGSTSAAVYSAAAPWSIVDSFAVGGTHVTAGRGARGLSTSITGAERIKTLARFGDRFGERGSRDYRGAAPGETIRVPVRSPRPGPCSRELSRPRVEETLELLQASG